MDSNEQIKSDIRRLQEGLKETEKYTYTSRELLIFLDETEKDKNNIGPASSELLIALAQKASPILASTSLLKNVFSEYGKYIPEEGAYKHLFAKSINKVGKEENEALLTMYNELSNLPRKKNESEIIAYKYILLKALHFDPSEWIIKKVTDFLYLFIPVVYLNSNNIDVDKVAEDNAQITTSAELQLGLHVNHMQTSSIENIVAQQIQKMPYPNYFMEAVYNDIMQTSTIFCLRSEYIDRNIPLPKWTILIMGHGDEGARIVGLEKDDFKKLLDFLEHKIICKLFIYNSCFSAGLNIEIIYKNLQSMIQSTYSFPIIMHALTDAVTVAMKRILKLDNNGNLFLTSDEGKSFAAFFNAASQPEITDYKDLVQHIYNFGPGTRANDTPLIKMPGLEWFSAIEANQIASIGHVLATSRSPNQPLNIEKFFNNNPKHLLLYAADIPFEIQLNSNIEAIVSMIPGNAIHKIEKVSSVTKNATDILELFMKIKMLGFTKVLFIKEIQGIDKTIQNVIVLYKKTSGAHQNVEDRYSCIAYFFDGLIPYVKSSLHAKIEQAGQWNTDEYQTYLQVVTNEPQHIPTAFYSKGLDWPVIDVPGPFPLSARAIIETIETKKPEQLISILDAIDDPQRDPGSITLIKQLSGLYDKTYFTIHNDFEDKALTYGTPITLTNVIVDKDARKIFFTFEGNFYEGKHKLSHDYLPAYLNKLIPSTPFIQREGSLLPVTIEAQDIKKIKSALQNLWPRK